MVRPMNPPAFVICRDLLTWTQQTVAALEAAGLTEIYLIDNDSTYRPLLDWYEETEHTVVFLRANLGKKGPWESGLIAELAGDRRFIATDPDVVPDEGCPTDWVDHFDELLDRYPRTLKVGFSLRVDDLPEHYAHRDTVIAFERQFALDEHRVDDGWVAPLDSTLALYRPRPRYGMFPAIRTAAPYVARHLPWYLDSREITPELRHYRTNVSPLYGHWAKHTLPPRVHEKVGKIRRGREGRRAR